MAFTEQQRVDIRMYMGYPALYLQVYSLLEMAMDAIEQVADSQQRVIDLLASLGVVDAQITDAYNRIQADQVGEMKIGRMSEINILRSEGRRLVGRLSAILNVEPRLDAFGEAKRNKSNYLQFA